MEGGEHFLFGRLIGVADPHPHHEPIELSLGQRPGTLELDRILGGDDEELRG